MAKKLDMPKEEIEKLVDYGFTQDQMAEYFGCSTPTIKKRMKDYGVDPSGGSANLGKIVMELREEIDALKESLENKDGIKADMDNDGLLKMEPQEEVITVKISSVFNNYSFDKYNIVVSNRQADIYVRPNETIEVATGIYLEVPEGIQLQSSIIFDNRRLYGTCVLSGDNEIIVILNNYHAVDHYEIAKNNPIAKLSFIKNVGINLVE